MKRWILAVLAGALFAAAPRTWAEEGAHRIGVGAHYWTTVDSISLDDFDEDGVSWVATYQYRPGILGLGIDVGWKEKGFAGTSEDIFEPQAYLIVGTGLYAAAGVGMYYSDGEFSDDPFYLLRAGFDFEVLPSIRLDIHAVYRFEEWDDLSESESDIDSNTITLGAAIRIAL